MFSKVWNEITYPFPDFNGYTVEVWEWISNFILHIVTGVIHDVIHTKIVDESSLRRLSWYKFCCDYLMNSLRIYVIYLTIFLGFISVAVKQSWRMQVKSFRT